MQQMGKNAMHVGKMHIACPNCHAVYDVPESRLSTALSLRCSACNYYWPVAPISSGPAHPPEERADPSGFAASSYAEMAQATAPEAASAPEPASQPPSVSSVTVASVTVSSVTTVTSVTDPPVPAAAATNGTVQDPAPFTPAPQPETADSAHSAPIMRDTSPIPQSQKPGLSAWNWGGILLWIILLCLVLLTLAVLARHEVVKLIPGSARLFLSLGLT